MTEPILPRHSNPNRTTNRPGASTGEKFACVYCPRRLSSSESLWDHVKRDHASKIQRHGAPGEIESLKQEVIDAGMGKERRLLQKSKGAAGRQTSRIATETAPSSIDMNRLTLDNSPKQPIRGRRYMMVHGTAGSGATYPRRAADLRGHSKKQLRKQESSDLPVVSDTLPDTPDHLSEDPDQACDGPPSPSGSSGPEEMLRQPQSKEISEEQLSQEVKSIYAGLTKVESKCIRVCDPQTATLQKPDQPGAANTHTHYQALITLHRTLLHEHHDFLLASQHPSAGPALKRLALKYSMPARMWKHGIFSFLELLRHRLPETMDYLVSFLILAYQMIALLYETVPAFKDTWIECLGDLARYRMAIDETRDRDIWQGVARHWYSKAASRNPFIGRLFHHLAILARPRLVEQLYFYCRSLTCAQSFRSSRESIRSLFDPSYTSQTQLTSSDTTLVQAHRSLFERESMAEFDSVVDSFLQLLDNQIGRISTKWKEQGSYIALINITALFDYGSSTSLLGAVFHVSGPTADGPASAPKPPARIRPTPEDESTLIRACHLLFSTFSLVLQRVGDQNVLPHINLVMEFLYCSIIQDPAGTAMTLRRAPWNDIASFLNVLMQTEKISPRVEEEAFPEHNQPDRRPLPEDFLAQGQVWCARYLFPDDWFQAFAHFDEEERALEVASMTNVRQNRLAWLGIKIAQEGKWLNYDFGSRRWSAVPQPPEIMMRSAPSPSFVTPESQDVQMTDAPAEGTFSAEAQAQPPRTSTHGLQPQRAHNISPSIAQEQIIIGSTEELMARPDHLRSLIQAGKYRSILVLERVVQELRAARQDSKYHDLATNSLGLLQEAIVSAGGRIQLLTEKGDVVAIEQILPLAGSPVHQSPRSSTKRYESSHRSSPPTTSRPGKRSSWSKTNHTSKSGSPTSVDISQHLVDWEGHAG